MYKILLIFVVFLTGLVISLQSVFGINIGNILNLQGNKITNVGTPTVAGDAATKGTVDSAASVLQTRVSGSCPAGQGMRAIAADGSVVCQVTNVPPAAKTCGGNSGNPITYVIGGVNFVKQEAVSAACVAYCGSFSSSVTWGSLGDLVPAYPNPSAWFDFSTCSIIGRIVGSAAAGAIQDESCGETSCSYTNNWGRCTCN